MKIHLRLASTVTMIAMLTGLTVTQPAHAADFTKILQSITGGFSSWDDLDAKRAQIDTELTAALNARQLSASEASSFRAELAQIDQQEAQIRASGGRLSFTQSLNFTNQLTDLSSRIEQSIQAKTAALPDVDAEQRQLQQQIDVASSAGNLTRQDASNLKHALSHVADIEAAFKASGDGTLNTRQVQILADDLDHVKADLDQQTRSTQSALPQLNDRRAHIEREINEGVSSGKFTQQQGADFKQDLDRINRMQQNFVSTSGALSGNQILTLAGELDRLDGRIDAALSVRTTTTVQPPAYQAPPQTYPIGPGAAAGLDLDARIDQLRHKIAGGLMSGRITPQEANQFNADLDEVANNANSLKDDDGNISDDDRIAIAGDLDRIGFRADQLFRVRRTGLPNIDARRAQVLKRINDGQASGKLTRLEYSLLMREYGRITRMERMFRGTAGSLNSGQSARLSSDLSQLDMLINQEMSTRGSSAPTFR